MVLELCAMGDLLHYLADNELQFKENNQGLKELTSLAWQVADGASYIASKDIIHRDLAARNVLLTKTRVAKIADFGLAIRSDESFNVMQRGLIPIKWTAIEALKENSFSVKSDVWSMGVVLYEIYSCGQIPYKNIPSSELQMHLLNGNRLEKPEMCPDEIYLMMRQCWNGIPKERPDFENVKNELTKVMLNMANYYGYLDVPESDTVEYVETETDKL
ncbi:hypothetical protein WR25_16368 [Diploscapter pachys]|uniref:Protein kinase domain-containing protein n=1 Tax=Diploscapter pachys TaxID=2018661 RepID=A0A2A2KUX3_9BILA|nr:hypothetical protein WR25_16368 [Diploscapter pachys]